MKIGPEEKRVKPLYQRVRKRNFLAPKCQNASCSRHIKGAPMRINLVPEEKRKPLYHAMPRVVPLHWREETDKIVRNLLKHDVIERVDYPTLWCSRAFFVAKPGGSRGLRLVTDYRTLNKNISRAHHFFPSISDIKKRISPDTKYFIKLDLTSSVSSIKNRQSRQRPHHLCYW